MAVFSRATLTHAFLSSSSTANLISFYTSSASIPKKRIDFCLYIDPSNDTVDDPNEAEESTNTITSEKPVEAATIRLRRMLPNAVVNHTNYDGLREQPVAVAIETKRPSEGLDGASLQMGIWLNAHWSFLSHLDHLARGAAPLDAISQTDCKSPELPDFLPGIITTGHDWHFILTTVQGEKMTLWRKLTLGSTSSPLGVYQIVCALQVLRQWTEDTYWPWLRERIMRF